MDERGYQTRIDKITRNTVSVVSVGCLTGLAMGVYGLYQVAFNDRETAGSLWMMGGLVTFYVGFVVPMVIGGELQNRIYKERESEGKGLESIMSEGRKNENMPCA